MITVPPAPKPRQPFLVKGVLAARKRGLAVVGAAIDKIKAKGEVSGFRSLVSSRGAAASLQPETSNEKPVTSAAASPRMFHVVPLTGIRFRDAEASWSQVYHADGVTGLHLVKTGQNSPPSPADALAIGPAAARPRDIILVTGEDKVLKPEDIEAVREGLKDEDSFVAPDLRAFRQSAIANLQSAIR